jgi:hypothetical protein
VTPREKLPQPSRGSRLLVCCTLAVVAGYVTYLLAGAISHPRDFAPIWYAGRVLLEGGDPYAAVGPGRTFAWPWPLYYPLPAAILAIPLAPLPQPVAMGIFSMLGAGALAWALSERELAPLLAFLSLAVWDAIAAAQWSPLLAASFVLTPLSLLLVAKPTVGAALFAARPSAWALSGAGVLIVASFAVRPDWIGAWLESLSGARDVSGAKFPSVIPATLPGGALALAACLRWRRPEARLVGALACVPLTMAPYESVYLFLVPRGWRQSLVLVVLSNAAVAWMFLAPREPVMTARMRLFGTALVWAMYIPATVMILRRPNEGAIPRWLERCVARWPESIRGRSNASN